MKINNYIIHGVYIYSERYKIKMIQEEKKITNLQKDISVV